VNRCFVNMVPAPSLLEARMCASNNEFGANRLQVTGSRRREDNQETRYQRNNRGPSIAPANVHSTIVPPYQTATNGNESSMQ
jgi:hypothetical protein